jgi:hypothetical protein
LRPLASSLLLRPRERTSGAKARVLRWWLWHGDPGLKPRATSRAPSVVAGATFFGVAYRSGLRPSGSLVGGNVGLRPTLVWDGPPALKCNDNNKSQYRGPSPYRVRMTTVEVVRARATATATATTTTRATADPYGMTNKKQ